MPLRHADLFGQIASFSALHKAALRAATGKRSKPGVAAFMARLEPMLLRMERALQERRWRSGRYTEMLVRSPKERQGSAAPFRDRVVHHALCAVIGSIFERGFVDESYANGAGKGVHRALPATRNTATVMPMCCAATFTATFRPLTTPF